MNYDIHQSHGDEIRKLTDSQHRLKHMHKELGKGEGVTELVAASMADLHAGGSGIVSSEGNADAMPDWRRTCRTPQIFEATVEFFAKLSGCSSGLMQLPPERREDILQHRLKECNELLCSARSRVRYTAHIQRRACIVRESVSVAVPF